MDIASIKTVLNKPVFLTGLMGAGKTSIGKKLADNLGASFMDADTAIVERAGMSIPDIFDLYGEERFRILERDVIADLSETDQLTIIGLGGGAFIDEGTREKIKACGVSIFIKADLEVLVERVGSGQGRPLLEQSDDPSNKLKELIELRYPIYDQADLIVETQNEALDKTVGRVMESLYMYLKP